MSVMIEPFIRALHADPPFDLSGRAGKIIMGLRVVGTGGSRLGFWRSLRRVIGYFISAFALHLGILMGDREQGAPQSGRQTGWLVGRLRLARPPRCDVSTGSE